MGVGAGGERRHQLAGRGVQGLGQDGGLGPDLKGAVGVGGDQLDVGHPQGHGVDREVPPGQVVGDVVGVDDVRLARVLAVGLRPVGRDLEDRAPLAGADRAERGPDVPRGGCQGLHDPQDVVGLGDKGSPSLPGRDETFCLQLPVSEAYGVAADSQLGRKGSLRGKPLAPLPLTTGDVRFYPSFYLQINGQTALPAKTEGWLFFQRGPSPLAGPIGTNGPILDPLWISSSRPSESPILADSTLSSMPIIQKKVRT